MTKKLQMTFASSAAAVLVLILGATYFASPYMAVASLGQAIDKGDQDKIEKLIDFPALRDNLKADLNAVMMERVQSDPDLKDNPLAAMSMVMIPGLLNQMIDVTFTSAQLARQRGEAPAFSAITPDKGEKKPDPKMAYEALDRFAVSYDVSAGLTAKLTLKREGLFTWRVKRIELPMDALKAPGI